LTARLGRVTRGRRWRHVIRCQRTVHQLPEGGVRRAAGAGRVAAGLIGTSDVRDSCHAPGPAATTRWIHVVLDPDGPLEATVERRIPGEDGLRLDLRVAGGRLAANAELPGPAPSDTVRLRVTGGVRYP
jgi:hypothetical protein